MSRAPAGRRAPAPEADRPPRILIATDAYRPQVNGVARTLEWLAEEATALGAEIVMLTPERFPTIPAPSYPALPLALATPAAIAREIERHRPDAVHIATEGPIGFLARRHCRATGRPFTTCYHTRFPEYLAARWPIPLSWSYAALRRFHNAAAATMVSTPALKAELESRGFNKLVLWRRGIPLARFTGDVGPRHDWPRPAFLYVGRVAVEKNLEAFLDLDLPGTKIVVGDGPARAGFEQRYQNAIFTGRLDGVELARAYASADAFVFPSLTDTFGLVMLEAMAAGLPIAAFPVTGPRDVVGDSGCGVLDTDLRKAALAALDIPRDRCRAHAARHSMRESARGFLDNIATAIGVRAASLQAAG